MNVMDNMSRIILHVDMDSFFAAVEMREHPELKGKPVVVGADPKGGKGRGVVSTASYEARKFGIHSAMPISRAYRLCPQGVFLPVNFPLYTRVSAEIMEILKNFAVKFEQVSIDEAYLDVSALGSFEGAREMAEKIKEEIRENERLTCSIGVGPSKIVAKIASDFNKPDGLTVVEPDEVEKFLSSLPVRKIPGVGKKTEAMLKELGISTVGELARIDVQELVAHFGKWGVNIHELAHGEDHSEVRSAETYKSISREHTFQEDTSDITKLHEAISGMAEDLYETLVSERLLFRTLTLKVRYEHFQTYTRARTLDHSTRDLIIIRELAKALLKGFLGEKKIRLIGVRLSKIEQKAEKQRTIADFMKE
jgi:DNA polymerase IV (DinB-like DNA polymerase)